MESLIHNQPKDGQETSKNAEKRQWIAYQTTKSQTTSSTRQRIANKQAKTRRYAKKLLIEQKRRETLKDGLLSKNAEKR